MYILNLPLTLTQALTYPQAWWSVNQSYSLTGTTTNEHANCGGRNTTTGLPMDPTRGWVSVSAWDCSGRSRSRSSENSHM